jgi:MFS superfamily sulfate permease-like transporter
LYFNVEHVRRVVWQRIRAAPVPVQLVVWDLSTSPYVDVAGARMLAALHTDLAAAGIELRVVEAHAAVRDILRAEGLEERIGQISRKLSVDDSIEAIGHPLEPRAQPT